MEQYLATFHTHLAALCTQRKLSAKGICAQMSPVPRMLSSSCGTCVRYKAQQPMPEEMDADTQAVYLVTGEKGYQLLYEAT